MNQFKEAQEHYCELLGDCPESNFNATCMWMSCALRGGKIKAGASLVRKFLLDNLGIYMTSDHMTAAMLQWGCEYKIEKGLHLFYIDKHFLSVMSWWDYLVYVERDIDNFCKLTPYVKRKITIPALLAYLKYKEAMSFFKESQIYKDYKKENEVYFKS